MKKHYKCHFLVLLIGVFINTSAWAQEKNVTGKVTDAADGSALPGVTIIAEGTTNGTVTDIDGNYSISVGENATLVYSFVGYETIKKVVGAQSTINVNLYPDIQQLSEVVVVGYGTQKKTDVTGSVTAISAEDFNSGLVTTPQQLITGKVAGVQITNNGAPGGGSRIRIRGGSSLSASNDPLIVVDGVPLDNQELKGSSNPLSFINPQDIESFNILKDASATAIYGSRASNGVILITTKKGKKGQKLSLSFNTLHSISTVPKTIDVLSADEFRRVVTERGNEEQTSLLGDANTDWQDVIYEDGYSMDHNLSIAGTIKALPYRISLGYLNQEGILKTSEFERKSAAISLNPTFLNDHLKLNVNVKGMVTNSRFADVGAIGAAIAFDPTQPVYSNNEDFGGYYQWLDPATGRYYTLATRNPLSMLEQRDDIGEVKRSIGNMQLDYKFHFLPDLRANLNLGYDISESEGSNNYPITYAPERPVGGRISPYEQSKTNKLLDFYLNYTKDLKELNSRVEVVAGYSYQNFEREVPTFPSTNIEGDTLTPVDPFPFKTHNTLIGVFGRINYALLNRYLLTINVRRDGTSKFGEGNKWGTFPSMALGWRINEEGFLRNSKVLSELKLRVGYGVTGQQDIGSDFPYLARYTTSEETAQYQFGEDYYNTLRPEGYDADIKWEETTTYNAGLDFGFLNGRLTGSLDYYFKKTKDLLSVIPVAAGTNLTNQLYTNVGNIENEGFEAALNYYVVDNDQFTWEVGINGTFNESKITKLSKISDENAVGLLVGGISGGTGNNVQVHTVGYAPYSFYVYKQVYDESGAPIEGLYADLNGDGIVSEEDKYRYESPNPDFYFGFSSQVGYKNWQLGFVLRGSVGNYMYNNINSNGAAFRNITYANYLTNVTSDVLETNFENNQYFSDYYVENASFLRMENITLSYDFGKIFKEKLYIQLTANVQNAFVITEYSGLDPETQFNEPLDNNLNTVNTVGGGIDNNFYPRPRIYSLGLTVGF